MIHHRPQALDRDLARRRLLIRNVVIDGGLMLGLTLPMGRVGNVDTWVSRVTHLSASRAMVRFF
jgi:hypothetical protein